MKSVNGPNFPVKNSKGVRTRGLRLDFNEIGNLIMIQVWKRK